MSFIKYLMAHFLFALLIFCIGYYVCKKWPSMFGGLPVLGSGSL